MPFPQTKWIIQILFWKHQHRTKASSPQHYPHMSFFWRGRGATRGTQTNFWGHRGYASEPAGDGKPLRVTTQPGQVLRPGADPPAPLPLQQPFPSDQLPFFTLYLITNPNLSFPLYHSSSGKACPPPTHTGFYTNLNTFNTIFDHQPSPWHLWWQWS